MADLEASFNSLLTRAGCDYTSNVVPDNPFLDKVWTTSEAEAVAIFDICALAEIGNTKNNLIGVVTSLCVLPLFALLATIVDLW